MESVGAFLDGEWESICKLFTADEDQEPDYTMELLLSDHHQSLTSLSNLTTNQGANTIFDHHGIGVNCGNLNALNINSHINYFSHGNTCTTSTATTSSDHSGDGNAFLPTPTTTNNNHHHPGENYYGYDQSLAASSMAYCMMEQNVQNGGSNTMASGITSSIYDIQNMIDYEMMNPTNNEGCVSGNHIIHPVSNNDDDSPSAPSSTKDVGIEMEQKNTTSTTVPVPKKRGRVAKDGQKGKKKRKQSRATSRGEEEEENKDNMINGGGGPNNNNNNNSSSSDVQMNSDNESNVSDEINGEENDNKVGAVKKRASRGAATDPQSLYARKRRERINERLRILQNLVPNGTKVDISTMLEEAVHYVKFLQLQIKLLSSDEMWMYAPLAYNGVDVSQYRKFSPFMI